MMLYSLPRLADHTDAIAVLPGLGEDWRLIDAVRAWERSGTVRHLFVAGTNGAEKAQTQPSLDYLQAPPISLSRHDGVRTQVAADHTKAQADWLVEQVKETGTTSMAIFVSPYHLLRGYCTVLKAFDRHGVKPI